MNGDIQGQKAAGFLQKLRLALIAFHEMHAWPPEYCENQARQAGTAAEIHGRTGGSGHVRQKLGAIQDVTAPGIDHCFRSDQVDSPLPALQQVKISLQAIQCFT